MIFIEYLFVEKVKGSVMIFIEYLFVEKVKGCVMMCYVFRQQIFWSIQILIYQYSDS